MSEESNYPPLPEPFVSFPPKSGGTIPETYFSADQMRAYVDQARASAPASNLSDDYYSSMATGHRLAALQELRAENDRLRAIIESASDSTARAAPVAWIDPADFETLEQDGWCVVHASSCDPGSDHNADAPLYLRVGGTARAAPPENGTRVLCGRCDGRGYFDDLSECGPCKGSGSDLSRSVGGTARAAPTDENADWLKGYTAGQSLAHAYYDNPQIKEARSIIESADAALRVGGTARAAPTWRPEVVAFANAMERKLRDNDWKCGWKGDASGPLMDRVGEEFREFKAAHLAYPRDNDTYRANLLDEAADVANMAMMVVDVCGALPLGIGGTARAEPVAWLMEPNAKAHPGLKPDVTFHQPPARDDWVITPLVRAGGAVAPSPEPTARAALAELVALKDLKDRLHQLHEMGHGTDYGDYHRRQPLAWAAARAALSGVQPPNQPTAEDPFFSVPSRVLTAENDHGNPPSALSQSAGTQASDVHPVERLLKFEQDVEILTLPWLDTSSATDHMTPTERVLRAVESAVAVARGLHQVGAPEPAAIASEFCSCQPTRCEGEGINRCRWKLMNYAPEPAVVEPTDATDAKRYRWLRSVDSYAEWNRVGHFAADALDATIDRALAAVTGL